MEDSNDTKDSESPDDPDRESASPKVIWASIPGISKTMRWPVKVVKLPLVYCNCDKAWLRLKGGCKEEFPNNMDKWKSAAEKCLKRKPETLASFLKDVEWALECKSSNSNPTETEGKTTDIEKEASECKSPNLNPTETEGKTTDIEKEASECESPNLNPTETEFKTTDIEKEASECKSPNLNPTETEGKTADIEKEASECESPNSNPTETEGKTTDIEKEASECKSPILNPIETEGKTTNIEKEASEYKSPNLNPTETEFKTTDIEKEASECKSPILNPTETEFKTTDIEKEASECESPILNPAETEFKTTDIEKEASECKSPNLNPAETEFKTTDFEKEASECKSPILNPAETEFKTTDIEKEASECKSPNLNPTETEGKTTDIEKEASECESPNLNPTETEGKTTDIEKQASGCKSPNLNPTETEGKTDEDEKQAPECKSPNLKPTETEGKTTDIEKEASECESPNLNPTETEVKTTDIEKQASECKSPHSNPTETEGKTTDIEKQASECKSPNSNPTETDGKTDDEEKQTSECKSPNSSMIQDISAQKRLNKKRKRIRFIPSESDESSLEVVVKKRKPIKIISETDCSENEDSTLNHERSRTDCEIVISDSEGKSECSNATDTECKTTDIEKQASECKSANSIPTEKKGKTNDVEKAASKCKSANSSNIQDISAQKRLNKKRKRNQYISDESSLKVNLKKRKRNVKIISETNCSGNEEDTHNQERSHTDCKIIISESDKNSPKSEVFPLLCGNLTTCSKDEEDSDGLDATLNQPVIRNSKNPNIYISCPEKGMFTKSGKRKKTDRKYNSRHVCPFCNKKKTNFSHHILSKQHDQEEEVKIIKNTVDGKKRKRLINQLRLKANHEHNLRTLKEKKGEIFLLRRLNAEQSESEESEEDDDLYSSSRSKTFQVAKYGPCPNCMGWVLKKSLRRHFSSCSTAGSITWTNRALETQSDMIAGKLTSEASQALINEVYPIMKGDDISKIAKDDDLIVNLGNQWLMRNRGNAIMRKYYTSSVMRLAAKHKIACQKLSKTDLNMVSFLAPKYFEIVLKAALACCHIDEDDAEELKAPSNAIKLGFDIKRMLSAKLSKAIIAEDLELQRESTDFLRLMEIQWGLRVTKLARGLLVERSYGKSNELPRPSDVKNLFQYLKSELTKLDLTDQSYNTYRSAVTLTLARLTLYNRRRCHEVQAMRLVSYAARTTGVDEIGLEIRQELTEFERVLLTTQEVVVIRGKTGKGVPVILPGDVREPMKYITNADVRAKAGIQEENKYVFGSKGVGVFRAYDAIREVTQAPAAGLQMPDLLRTSNMRKYMATMLQALNTTEAERQWVLDHLGHTMNVHRTHYRQTSDVLERIDVAKVLLIQDFGLVSKYRGKKIQDIQIEDMMGEANGGEALDMMAEEDGGATEEDGGAISKSTESSENSEILYARVNDSEDEIIDFDQEDSSDGEDEEFLRKKKRKAPKTTTRQKWTEDEVNELKDLFSEEFRTNCLPGQNKIEKMMKKSEINKKLIYKRKRDTIKKKISNMLIKKRREEK